MQHHRMHTKLPERVKLPTTFIAYGSNQVWTWDITWLNTYTKGIYYKSHMVIDIFSRKIVAWEVWNEENGATIKSYTLKAKLELLGVISSYSRPRVSNDNPFSEAQFKTMKYRPGYPKDGFDSIERAREWVSKFVNWYNNEHYHSRIKFMTPASPHNGKTEGIMNNRIKVYETARALNLSRFNKGIRNWTPPEKVALNPTNEVKNKLKIV